MYGIKRNIKRNPVVVKSSTNVEPLVNRNPHRLKSNGLGTYNFPRYDEVPAGTYFSKISNAHFTTTKSGKNAIEIYYEIQDAFICQKIANEILPKDAENQTYYIKQTYPEGTIFYDKFIDAMTNALCQDEFELEEVIGVTEVAILSYDNSDIGGFSERKPFDYEDFINIDNDDDDYIYED